MAKKTRIPVDAYQLKITLHGSKPPIWRRFVVPANIPLDRLHDVIQIVKGWSDSHLHAFVIDNEYYEAMSKDGEPLDAEGLDERKFRLNEVVGKVKTKFRYDYDFGDNWEHVLLLEKIIPAAQNPATPVCSAGRGACPAEDCGGIWGYYELLDILADPSHPEHEERKKWVGGIIDPDEFDLEEINKALRR